MIRRAIALRRMLRARSVPASRLREESDIKLRLLLRRAARDVPYFRELFMRGGVNVDAVRGAVDLPRLPVTEKSELRAAGSAAWAPLQADDVWINTSGSTGMPYRFPISSRYDQLRKAQYLRPYLDNPRRLRDRVLRLTAFANTRQPIFMRLGLLRELQMDCGSPPSLVLERWRTAGCSILQGYPSALRVLAQYCLDSGEQISPAPRAIFTDSELLSGDTRRVIETAFHSKVTDVFGSYETDNIAYQCEAGRGYHVTTDTVVVEILRNGRVAPHGEEGELVVTVLDNHRSPFIRYNLHDLASWAVEPCDCGRSYPLLQGIKGRSDHLLLLPDGTERSAMDVLGRLDGFTDVVLHYQLRQHSARRYSLLYVPTPAWVPANERLLAEAAQLSLGDAEIKLRRVASIPLTASRKWLAFVREPDDDLEL